MVMSSPRNLEVAEYFTKYECLFQEKFIKIKAQANRGFPVQKHEFSLCWTNFSKLACSIAPGGTLPLPTRITASGYRFI